jgi:membrane protein DedA with SNARE-associated domain
MAILTILGWIGDAFFATLLNDAPLLLLVCNPRLRNLILVAPETDAIPYVLVASARLLISDPLFYIFGKRYGDVAIRWMERQLGRGAAPVLWFERMFRKAGYVMIAVLPNNWICLLAGATGIAWMPFLIVNVVGTVVRMTLIRVLGDAFSDPILKFNNWIGDNRAWITIITVGIVVITIATSMRKGRTPLETPTELADELEAAESDDETSG